MQKVLGWCILIIFGSVVILGMLGGVIRSGVPRPAVTPAARIAPRRSPVQSFASSSFSKASQALIRIDQLDPDQYASMQDYKKWAYAACSAAAMTENINAYGYSYHIKDVLEVEARLGEITPNLGLVEPSGIDHTVAQFGFRTKTLISPTLNDIITIGNQGQPVIVSFPPDRWDGGHILIVRGGDSSSVSLADSSRYNMTVMTQATFLKYWGGFAVVVTPMRGGRAG